MEVQQIEKPLFTAAKNQLLRNIRLWLQDGKDSASHGKHMELSLGYSQWSFQISGSKRTMPRDSERVFFSTLEKQGIVTPHPLGGWAINFNFFK